MRARKKIARYFQKIKVEICRFFQPAEFRRVSWGKDFPDKSFLLIRRNDAGAGLFSHFTYFLSWIAYAVENRMVPVIDLQNRDNLYLKQSEIGRINAWELFFKQPFGFNLSDIKNAKDIIIRDGISVYEKYSAFSCLKYMKAGDSAWERIQSYARDYLKVKKAGCNGCNERLESELMTSSVIGVLARGTDYVQMRPKGHPVQPTVEQIARKIRAIDVEEGRECKIYLVSEDSLIRTQFLELYGESRVILPKQDPISYKSELLMNNAEVKGNIELARLYMKAIYDLSRCSYLIAGQTSGSMAAAILSQPSQKRFFFELGVY